MNKKEIFVKIGSKKNGRYYAAEEMSLNKFSKYLDQILKQFDYELPKRNLWTIISGKYKKQVNIVEWLLTGKQRGKEIVINAMKEIVEKDEPGKKVIK
jgi:hypothetical protein